MGRARPIFSGLIGIALLSTSSLAQQVGELSIDRVTLDSREGPKQEVEAEEGYLWVPERWADSSGAMIKLHFYRFASTSENPGPPIVYLAGGPGGSGALSSLGDRFPVFQALRQVGDVIAFDQRGVFGTEPYLVCPNRYDFPVSEPGDPEKLVPILEEFARECARHWHEQGVDLTAYHTNASADDLNALRDALGAERLTLWGISYGTHLALAYIRRHPDRVHRAILAGVEGPAHTLKLPSNLDKILARVDSLAKLDVAVNAAAPDVMGMARTVMDRLQQEAVFVNGPPGPDGEAVTVGISKFDVQDMIAGVLGDDEDIGLVPIGIKTLYDGDFVQVARIEARSRTGRRALAMSAAMDCASGVSPERWQRIKSEARESVLGDAINFPFPEICEFFPHTDLGDEFRSPVRSDAPVLFISGTLDARTPPSNAEEVREGFANSEHLIIDGGTHDDDLFLSSPLILEGMLEFLRGEPVSHLRIELDRKFASRSPWDN